jgi:hypothetical protein
MADLLELLYRYQGRKGSVMVFCCDLEFWCGVVTGGRGATSKLGLGRTRVGPSILRASGPILMSCKREYYRGLISINMTRKEEKNL